jgi:hypothetical protein
LNTKLGSFVTHTRRVTDTPLIFNHNSAVFASLPGFLHPVPMDYPSNVLSQHILGEKAAELYIFKVTDCQIPTNLRCQRREK